MRGTLDEALRGINSKARHTLDLSYYKIDDDGAHRIAQFLYSDKFVKRIILAWNEIWTEGARALAQAISTNSSLEVLDLSHNSIQAEGAEHIASSLKSNKTLRCLNLCDNNITDAGVKGLLESLEANRTLIKLEIEGNPIFDRDLKDRVKDRLQSNSTSKPQSNQPNVVVPVPDPHITRELAEVKAQNATLKKSLEKLKGEHNTLKNRMAAQENAHKDVAAQLQASIKERLALEKSIVDVSTRLEREKTKTVELGELEKQMAALKVETQEAKDRVSAMNAERRTLRQHNETLTRRISLLTGSADYEHVDLSELSELEDQLETTIKSIRKVKLLRLQRKLDEAVDARKCKVCFDNAVDSVLLPCMHHILCEISLISIPPSLP